MDRKWMTVSARQLGLITTVQLAQAGVTASQRSTLRRAGILVGVHKSIYRVGGAGMNARQRCLAAVLALEKGVLSHRAAAAEWGAERFADAAPELVVPMGRSVRLKGVTVHRSRGLRQGDVMKHGPLPRITRPALTVVHLADLEDVNDTALEEGGADLLLSYPQERRALKTILARRNTYGASRVKALFGDYLTDDRRPPHPGLEQRLLAVIAAASDVIPPPVVHLKLDTPAGRLEVDLAWPDVKLVVEADSARWHSSPANLRNDRARDQALASIGWIVVRFTWEQVRDTPEAVVACITAVRGQRQLRGVG